MESEKLCKTVHQYNKDLVSLNDMEKLSEIARDCQIVKNYVFDRYGGVKSLSKLYPGYTIQNEMTATGLRQQLELPSVYFYPTIFDALGSIKAEWTRVKTKIAYLVGENECLTADEKHYIRFAIKINNVFTAILQQTEPKLPSNIQKKYDELASLVVPDKMNRYLCRQVRKHLIKLHTEQDTLILVTKKGYRYGEHGIYLTTKQQRARIFIPLTDNMRYDRQLAIRLYPKEQNIVIAVPVDINIKIHEDYINTIGIAMGMFVMCTVDNGHKYGENLGEYQNEYAEWSRKQTINYNRNREKNSGRKKYYTKKRLYVTKLQSYINHELNRLFEVEKPGIVYLVKLPKPQMSNAGINKKINHYATMWQRGYIRKRLMQKCRENSVELVDVLGKDISRECSQCGTIGNKVNGIFVCKNCGYSIEEKVNTAKNVLNRGLAGKILH